MKIREEELPEGPEAKEQYFMSQVGLGEQLSTQGGMFTRCSLMLCINPLIQMLRTTFRPHWLSTELSECTRSLWSCL